VLHALHDIVLLLFILYCTALAMEQSSVELSVAQHINPPDTALSLATKSVDQLSDWLKAEGIPDEFCKAFNGTSSCR